LLLGIVSSFLRLLPPVSASPRNRGKSTRPLERAEDLIAPIWESDEELEQFLADVYAARRAARSHRP